MTPPLVTILDDEPAIRTMLADALEEAGFQTMAFGRATEFEAALRSATPDVCLVDLSLPDRDGLTLVHRLALEQGAAVIIISGRAEVQDKITGLELGADDYIIKPFDLRRDSATPQTGETARFNGWTAHFDRYVLEDTTAAETPFSHAEGEVLRLFLERPKRLISRTAMQEALGGAAGESFDRAMDVRISRLRTKLREDPKNPRLIKTIYGAGYIFLGDVSWT
jgi:DNA-binding response OmpR family regulator